MKKTTRTLLKRFRETQWFFAVGKPEPGVIVLSSWEEAIPSALSRDWGNLDLEMANTLRERIAEASVARINKWNDLATQIEELVEPIVNAKLSPLLEEKKSLIERSYPNSYPVSFETRVKLDVSGACLEEEFADLVAPDFGHRIASWYLRGHFPCGWKGDCPKGKLIIY